MMQERAEITQCPSPREGSSFSLSLTSTQSLSSSSSSSDNEAFGEAIKQTSVVKEIAYRHQDRLKVGSASSQTYSYPFCKSMSKPDDYTCNKLNTSVETRSKLPYQPLVLHSQGMAPTLTKSFAADAATTKQLPDKRSTPFIPLGRFSVTPFPSSSIEAADERIDDGPVATKASTSAASPHEECDDDIDSEDSQDEEDDSESDFSDSDDELESDDEYADMLSEIPIVLGFDSRQKESFKDAEHSLVSNPPSAEINSAAEGRLSSSLLPVASSDEIESIHPVKAQGSSNTNVETCMVSESQADDEVAETEDDGRVGNTASFDSRSGYVTEPRFTDDKPLPAGVADVLQEAEEAESGSEETQDDGESEVGDSSSFGSSDYSDTDIEDVELMSQLPVQARTRAEDLAVAENRAIPVLDGRHILISADPRLLASSLPRSHTMQSRANDKTNALVASAFSIEPSMEGSQGRGYGCDPSYLKANTHAKVTDGVEWGIPEESINSSYCSSDDFSGSYDSSSAHEDDDDATESGLQQSPSQREASTAASRASASPGPASRSTADESSSYENDYDELLCEMPIKTESPRRGGPRPVINVPISPKKEYPAPPPELMNPMEGLAMFASIRAELEQVGRMIVAKKDGEKFLQRAHILASINWLSASVPTCVLDHLGQELRKTLQEKDKFSEVNEGCVDSIDIDDDETEASALSASESHRGDDVGDFDDSFPPRPTRQRCTDAGRRASFVMSVKRASAKDKRKPNSLPFVSYFEGALLFGTSRPVMCNDCHLTPNVFVFLLLSTVDISGFTKRKFKQCSTGSSMFLGQNS
jgi:hypothetical protein